MASRGRRSRTKRWVGLTGGSLGIALILMFSSTASSSGGPAYAFGTACQAENDTTLHCVVWGIGEASSTVWAASSEDGCGGSGCDSQTVSEGVPFTVRLPES